MNCNNYSLTDHAKSRIISRFNIKNANQLDWAKMFWNNLKERLKLEMISLFILMEALI